MCKPHDGDVDDAPEAEADPEWCASWLTKLGATWETPYRQGLHQSQPPRSGFNRKTQNAQDLKKTKKLARERVCVVEINELRGVGGPPNVKQYLRGNAKGGKISERCHGRVSQRHFRKVILRQTFLSP